MKPETTKPKQAPKGACLHCGRPIRPGQAVMWFRAYPSTRWHARCAPGLRLFVDAGHPTIAAGAAL